MRNKWIKWTERKPKEGEPVVVVFCVYSHGKPAYNFLSIGTAVPDTFEIWWKDRIDGVYWIELPTKGE